MAKSRKVIITNNREIYDKLNMLHFSQEVVINNVKRKQIKRIINNFNKDCDILRMEAVGDRFLIKRTRPICFDVFFKSP